MKDHTDLLNYLATTFNLQSYLEIGVQYPENNFDKIRCDIKAGVDPSPTIKRNSIFEMTSDDFFKYIDGVMYFGKHTPAFGNTVKKWDIIFIDGLHHADQVKRDFQNSLSCLTTNGFIVLHDTWPTEEQYTTIPRKTRRWHGDVYKFACSLGTYSGIDYCTIDMDHGCTVVWRADKKGEDVKPVTNWQEFEQNKHLLKIVQIEEFKNLLLQKNKLIQHN